MSDRPIIGRVVSPGMPTIATVRCPGCHLNQPVAGTCVRCGMVTDRPLAPAVYDTTDSFREIEQHVAVCWPDDMTLVAVTGRAGDPMAEKYADLFAASPRTLAALEALAGLFTNTVTWDDHPALIEARAAIAQARGTHG